jgi:prepilin-type N-terminal cleavage/methylation domain-containing protein
MKKQRAFTLIEILVVIAIMGLLSSTILVALNVARSKARDARIKEDFHQLRVLAADYDASHGNWAGFIACTPGKICIDPMTGLPGPEGSDLYIDMRKNGADNLSLAADKDGWAFNVTLNENNRNTIWCADYTGAFIGDANGSVTSKICHERGYVP